MSDGTCCHYCRRYNCECKPSSVPAPAQPRTVIVSSYTCNNSPEYGCHTEKGREEAKRLGGCVLHPAPAQQEVKRRMSARYFWMANMDRFGSTMDTGTLDFADAYGEILHGSYLVDLEGVKHDFNVLLLDGSRLQQRAEKAESDYASLSEELKRVKEERDEMETAAHQLTKNCEEQFNRAESAESERDALREALEKINALQLDDAWDWERIGRAARDIAWTTLEKEKGL